MNITIQDRTYIAERDSNGWTLNSPYMGKEKDPSDPDKKAMRPALKHNETYYGKFEHLLKKIIDLEVGHCETLEEVKTMIENFPATQP